MCKVYENSCLNLKFLRKVMKTFIFSVVRKQCFPYLAIALKTVIHLRTVSVSFLVFHQEF